jgi:spore maturation protein SpmB
MNVSMTSIDEKNFHVVGHNAKGGAAALTETAQVVSSNPEVAAVTVGADGTSFVVAGVAAGQATVTASVGGFTAALEIDVAAAPIASIEIVEDPAAEQPQ